MQCHITKQLVHSLMVYIRISQPLKVMFTEANRGEHHFSQVENLDVNLKRMHYLCNVSPTMSNTWPFKLFYKMYLDQ